jgi:hypothetical protein
MLSLKWFVKWLYFRLFSFIKFIIRVVKYKLSSPKRINFYSCLDIYFLLFKPSGFTTELKKGKLKFKNSFKVFLHFFWKLNYMYSWGGKYEWFILSNIFNLLEIKNRNSSDFYSYWYSFSKKRNFNIVVNLNSQFLLLNTTVKFSFHKFYNFIIKFKPSNFLFFLSSKPLNNLNINFIRKSKIFNKGRYSRNRQYYRTGVYWCLYVNIILVIGLYFWFYRFLINFSYLWWLLFFFLLSFVLPKFFNLYNPLFLKNYFKNELNWLVKIIFCLVQIFNLENLEILINDIFLTRMINGKLFFFYLNN